jgi:hypothetical protein
VPVDVAKLKAKYNAQSELNSDALAAFTAQYPLIVAGATFTDANGLDWKVVSVLPFNNTVSVLIRYVDPITGDTDYITNLYSITGQRLMFTFADSFVTTDAGGGVADTIYFRPDMRYGEIVQVTIEGGPALNPATDFTWDANLFKLTITIAITPGQTVDTIYKKAPYYYGYP